MKHILTLFSSKAKTIVVLSTLLLIALFFSNIQTANAQGPFTEAFRTTWVTTDGQIRIPTSGTGQTYNYNISWRNLTNANVGDGAAYNVTSSVFDFIINGLENGSTYEIAIAGVFPHFYMNNRNDQRGKLRTIEAWGSIVWASMGNAFYGCQNLTYNATDVPNLSYVSNMSYMFAYCMNFNGNIGNWDTGNITDMYATFLFCANFNQPIGNWNTANVTTMSGMFQEARVFNQSIGNWNTRNVTNMSAMFFEARAFNQPIGNWNTSAVTTMSGMFQYNQVFNQDIGNWNTSAVTYMGQMFRGARAFNQNLGNWNISNVGGMIFMLDDCGMNTANYDATLIGWAAQTVKPNVRLDARSRLYCNALAARTTLTSAPNNWNIYSDFLACPDIYVQGNGSNIVNGTRSYAL